MSQQTSQASSERAPETRRELLRVMWASRAADLREQSLIRQGRGWFHIASMGHEAVASLAAALRPDDYLFPYYRDRALVMARGVTAEELARVFYAKRGSSSGGRQLPGHFSDRSRNVWSHPSPVGAHLLPACGAAWGMRLDGADNVVCASLGEAAARQGDFFEAVCFARERRLPVLFLVHDNRIAISTSTADTTPLALGVLAESEWTRVDGSDAEAVCSAGEAAIARLREGHGPAFLWCSMERFSNHSSADDQRMYRDASELEAMQERDPVGLYERRLIEEGVLSEDAAREIRETAREAVRRDYRSAEAGDDPLGEERALHMAGELSSGEAPPVPMGERQRMLDAVNSVFHAAIEHVPDALFFGEDIEDPKGGVFNLTRGLSTRAPERAFNSPVAESTILGVAAGLASYGKRPCFEIQFIDFIYPGWNQIVTNMATLRWRSFGHWKCPLVIYAPCGGYLPGGALWHSQAGESSLARQPGLRVVVPSTPEDAAGLFWSALRGDDPTFILLPKHLMWAERETPEPAPAVPIGRARIVAEGTDLTLVTWGNCVEVAELALEGMADAPSAELIDLRSIAPWDRDAVRASALKTGRLLVVQEDNVSCSVGQMIVAALCEDGAFLEALASPPALVSKDDVHVGFHPNYEYASLPDAERVAAAVRRLMREGVRASVGGGPGDAPSAAPSPSAAPTASAGAAAVAALKPIAVPILGEGIRVAKLVAVLKKAGESVEPDEALCEVETDKAVFPIECDEAGTLAEWKVAEGDEVGVGQEIAMLRREGAAAEPEAPAGEAASSPPPGTTGVGGERALSPEVVPKLKELVPATIEMTCRWEALRDARLRSKQGGGGTFSTTMMAAWCVTRAMERHDRFASVQREGELARDANGFDLGVAVALPGDVLETAVLPGAETLEWEAFPKAFNDATKRVRQGERDSKNRVPLTISSMGTHDVRSAIPIVAPPSVATLFIGAPERQPDADADDGSAKETVSLVLTFDHRWINGVGAASFLSDVRKGIERFDLV